LPSPVITGTPTGITAAHLEAGVLPSDVTGGSGLTALGTVTEGNLSNSAIVYPAGHILGSACLVDVTNGADGTSSTSNSLRKLNTVLYEVGFGVTISSDEWTFDQAGSYLITASAPTYGAQRTISRLYSGTGSTLEATGTAEYNTAVTNTRSFIITKLVITDAQKTSGASEKTFGIYSIVDAVDATNGHGVGNNESTVEQFTQVQIFKIQE
jgi:hypothetical protein